MNTPIATENYYKEREGVLKLALELNKYGYVFRETSNGDIGIDGQIEMTSNQGNALGKIVAAQIKSGDSYLVNKGTYYAFYPTEKHRNYWSIFPIPVILFVYSPTDNKIYHTDVRYQLNIPNRTEAYIRLEKTSFINSENHSKIFETAGGFGSEYYSLEKIFEIMVNTVCNNPTFNISYLDLFTQGLTNICRHIYFSMDLACVIADYNNDTEFGMSLGTNEYDFLNEYCKFIISQNLASIDYSDYLIDWNERQLVPMFISPLTIRGFSLLKHIETIESGIKDKLSPTTLIRERFIEMKFFTEDDFLRLEFGKQLRKLLTEKASNLNA